MNVAPKYVHAKIALPQASLRYVPGSTIKLCQLTGDFDSQLTLSTASRSASHYNVRATDLGATFEFGGRLFFLFGDTEPADAPDSQGNDCIAWTDATHVNPPPVLHWLRTEKSFTPVRVRDTMPGLIKYGPFCVPYSGFEGVDGAFYVFYTQASVDTFNESHAIANVLIRSDDGGQSFRYVYHASWDKFHQAWAHVVEASDWPGLPIAKGKVVLIWGTPTSNRKGAVYLACCALDDIERDDGGFLWIKRPVSWAYFCGYFDNVPFWSGSESDAVPIFDQLDEHNKPQIGEFSVAYFAELGLWLMLYCYPDTQPYARGVYCRQAPAPWGPWTRVEHAGPNRTESRFRGVIWTQDLGYAHYMHKLSIDPRSRDDGLNIYGDSFGPPHVYLTYNGVDYVDYDGGEYASYIVHRWSKVDNGTLTLRFTLSLWNPYQVVLLESRFAVVWNAA